MRTTLFILVALNLMTIAHRTKAANFSEDLDFLRQHTDVVLLQDKSGQSQVVVAPAWQGRVMTSTASGPAGTSYGWVNRDLIAARKIEAHINVFGGEDRFWLGPEGGQFSIFFAKGVPFELAHWFTPAALDTEPFETASKSDEQAHFRRKFAITNYSGTRFDVEVDREVRLLSASDALAAQGVGLPPGVKTVAYESVNSVKNAGTVAWRKESGLLSIWILGMYNASPSATVVVPFVRGPEATLGPVVNDDYFGKVPADRLVIRDGVIFFRADAAHRGKIGLSPRRAKPMLGSYDAVSQTLTLVFFTLPKGAQDYVNSMWKLQDAPYSGDVVNSYNDGPADAGGKQLGKFYELESSSPALALEPGRSATHVHQTIHVQGGENDLDALARSALGVGLKQIKSTFGK